VNRAHEDRPQVNRGAEEDEVETMTTKTFDGVARVARARRAARTPRRALAAAVLAAASLALVPTTTTAAEPDRAGGAERVDRAACAEAYKGAQTQRREGKLRRARESLLMCVSDRCPGVIQPDCMRWLTEVEAATPTLAFAAKGETGKDVTDVRVSLDGQVLAESLDGKSVPVDPGSHTLRFERAGEVAIEQPIVVREGEKARVVSVSWARVQPEASADRGAPRVVTSSNTAAWIFGGIGVASLAGFGVLAAHGMARRSDLENECFGSCRQSQVDGIKTELLVADVALGVGIVSLGVSAALFLTRRSVEAPPPAAQAQARSGGLRLLSVGAAPVRGGGGEIGLQGRF